MVTWCRTTRTLPQQIKELKAELPKPDAEGNRASSPLDQEISSLEQVPAMATVQPAFAFSVLGWSNTLSPTWLSSCQFLTQWHCCQTLAL